MRVKVKIKKEIWNKRVIVKILEINFMNSSLNYLYVVIIFF